MNNTSIYASLDNTGELRKMILDNPDLPLVIFAGEESYTGDYSYNLAEVSKIEIKDITYDGELYVDKDDCEEGEEFLKAIVVYVG